MESAKITVSGSTASLGSGQYKRVLLQRESGSVSFHVGNTSESIALGNDIFEINGPRGKVFDISLFSVTGTGQVTVVKFPDTSSEPVVNEETYSPESNFNNLLDEMFLDKFITRDVTWKTTPLRASELDEEILVGDGISQHQTIQKTLEFKIADLPSDWKIGDAVTIGESTYYANAVMEQDAYTVKILMSKNTR